MYFSYILIINFAINIKIEDLDFSNELISYSHTKNRKAHIIPMSSSLKVILQEFLTYRNAKSEEDWLFCNAYGEQLLPNGLTHILASYNQHSGVTKTGIHRWRHTFAKKWILNNGDIFRLQKILQHSSMSIVRNYVNMFSTDLQKDFNTFNPLEQMKQNKQHISMSKRGEK